MRKIWLIFSQTATVALAILFVVTTLKPEWLPQNRDATGAQVVELRQAVSAPGGEPRNASYNEAVKRAVPAVVNVFTSKEVRSRHPLMNDPVFRHFFGDQLGDAQRSSGLGSGVIVSPKGYVLTNHHVVDSADEIEVALADGRKLRARLVGSDPESDLAVLQLQGVNEALPAITFGEDSSLRLGDVVLAIGNPFGVGQTVTMGIVSGLGRTPGINTFENFIQTDAAINPGNSGGALVDSNGNLVGVNTAIYSRAPGGASLGIGFAIPVTSVRQVMEQIIANGTVTRGWIGVEAQEITAEIADSFRLPSTQGALIAGVIRGSPAEHGGVKPGDVLLLVEGKPVRDPAGMLNLVAALPPGKQATLRIRREQKELDLPVEVGRRPSQQKRR